MEVQTVLSSHVEKLSVQVFSDRKSLGKAAAAQVAAVVKELLSSQNEIRMIFAAAPSQNEFLEELLLIDGIDWTRITAFHMDEYIGLPAGAPQMFSAFLRHRLFEKVPFASVHLIDSTNLIKAECDRYEALLQEKPIDIVCLGIGENGHIAFNDPPVADFGDRSWVKPVELDLACRLQQVNDGCFTALEDVPTHAITLTIPALLSGAHLFCMVPGQNKREAVRRTLYEPISTSCPASILRHHSSCRLYVDLDSY
ncbi:glucosamine-6-phosphate deaminase [Paenibacillus aceris]|uniref:Glucosamine-6-phosphate deaminase n=1 Tax=Paenibacillus aceris TaxID=869555 RepID=A0ABS4I7R9_9BACL|nr:glucosamine-6-phosphate deaminase [Paenibacillus aceris]MBP1966441.1 glucosamine-6-phosphate deaminase [Paenibacillus aceris]